MAHAARLTGAASTHPPPLTLKRRLQRALKAADEMRLAIDESHRAEQGCATRDSSCRLARVSTAHSNHGAKTGPYKTHKRKVKERGRPRQDKEEDRQWVRHARAGRVTRTRVFCRRVQYVNAVCRCAALGSVRETLELRIFFVANDDFVHPHYKEKHLPRCMCPALAEGHA